MDRDGSRMSLLSEINRRLSNYFSPWNSRLTILSGGLVLATLFLERLAFYSVLTNLYIYLTKAWSSDEALSATLLLTGLAYFSALPAGWLADAVVGRYWTIIGGLCLYVMAYGALTTLAFNALAPAGCSADFSGQWCTTYIYAIIVAIGLAVGTVKSNVPAFGAAQMRHGNLRTFFSFYYWCINGGALLGVGCIAYWEQVTTNGFPAAFAVATGVLLLALMLMLAGKRVFVAHSPSDVSVISGLVHMVKEGVTGRIAARGLESPTEPYARVTVEGSEELLDPVNLNAAENSPCWLDFAKIRYGGSHSDESVDEAKKMGPVLLLLVFMIPYWLIFLQSNSGFQAQAVHLKVDLGDFMFPTAWLGLVDQIFVLALIPIVNGFFIPLLERMGFTIKLTVKISIGCVIAAFSILAAGGLETASIRTWQNGGFVTQQIGHATYNASTVSILWQAPQYCLLGTSEVFATIGSLELAHTLAPRALKGLVMGLLAAFEGLASFFSIGLLAAFTPSWIQPDATHFEGHYDYFFYLLAALQLTLLLLYCIASFVRNKWRGAANYDEDVLHS
ncbi:Hypothetical predicted protein [Cloeon dipterum]|uniref:Uncharacterized protein n=1 Tax=Cloeon dipterum TaxID=197152 RepID=A0A8S1DNK1_9INSE|nr:Hypothetical predicted protein [Cloeon dipterum]